MTIEEEDLSPSVVFLGIFLGNGSVFLVLHQTTRLNIQTVVLLSVRCCQQKEQKLLFYKEMHGNIATLYRLVKGFTHYFVPLCYLFCLLSVKSLFDIGSIFYTGLIIDITVHYFCLE